MAEPGGEGKRAAGAAQAHQVGAAPPGIASRSPAPHPTCAPRVTSPPSRSRTYEPSCKDTEQAAAGRQGPPSPSVSFGVPGLRSRTPTPAPAPWALCRGGGRGRARPGSVADAVMEQGLQDARGARAGSERRSSRSGASRTAATAGPSGSSPSRTGCWAASPAPGRERCPTMAASMCPPVTSASTPTSWSRISRWAGAAVGPGARAGAQVAARSTVSQPVPPGTGRGPRRLHLRPQKDQHGAAGAQRNQHPHGQGGEGESGDRAGSSLTRGCLECPGPRGLWAVTEGAAVAQMPSPLPGSSSSCRCASERPRTSS